MIITDWLERFGVKGQNVKMARLARIFLRRTP